MTASKLVTKPVLNTFSLQVTDNFLIKNHCHWRVSTFRLHRWIVQQWVKRKQSASVLLAST